MKYAIIGTGDTSESAVKESLRDVLTEDDTVLIGWFGRPMPEVIENVYGYLLDNEVQFNLYHRPEQEVTRHFRDADNCTVTQSRHPLDAMLKEADEVLFLWDDAENAASPPLIQYVMDHINDEVKVKELSNGLAPIVIDYEMPEPEPANEPQEEEQDDMRFTREELEVMTAVAVKRYGERMGCSAKTKSGIIEELFDEVELEKHVDNTTPQDDTPIVAGDTQHVSAPQWDRDLINLISDFLNHSKPGFETDMAHLTLGQARLWMLKSLAGE